MSSSAVPAWGGCLRIEPGIDRDDLHGCVRIDRACAHQERVGAGEHRWHREGCDIAELAALAHQAGGDAGDIGRVPVRDIIGAEIVERVAAVAFVERDLRRALRHVVEKVGVVRGREHHAGILGDELAVSARRIGGVGDALHEHGLHLRERRFHRLHPLVVTPRPAFVGDGTGVAEGDHGIFLGDRRQRRRGARGADQAWRQQERGTGGGTEVQEAPAGQMAEV